MGQTWDPPARPTRPAHEMGLHLRRYLSRQRQGCRAGHALVRHPRHGEVDPGAHAILLLDQAGWHTSSKLAVPDNITLVPIPPRSPELNPVENVWQFIRDNWLSNRVFRNYDDIVAHCCESWNKLMDQPWRIASIGRRTWAHEF